MRKVPSISGYCGKPNNQLTTLVVIGIDCIGTCTCSCKWTPEQIGSLFIEN